MGMIALVQSCRYTMHVNSKQYKETNGGFKVRCGITSFNRKSSGRPSQEPVGDGVGQLIPACS